MNRSVQPGRLLVASPALRDPNFLRSVVLVLDHSEAGTVGVVLNRPSTDLVHDALPEWGAFDPSPGVLHHGGPVSQDAVIALAVALAGTEHVGLTCVHDRIRVIDLSCEPEAYRGAVEGVRLLAGYAGWDGGQLEDELDEGAWFVVDSEARDALDDDPASLWARVLGRQAGPLRLLATYPEDPSAN